MNCTVLVVDDQPDTADSMAMWLELAGHRALRAYTGREALRVAASERPDVVLLDITLPDISGYEVARAILAEPHSTPPRLAALTGRTLERDRELERRAGFSQFFLKPVDPMELTDWLTRVAHTPDQSSGSMTLR